jgi:hypothetical protein
MTMIPLAFLHGSLAVRVLVSTTMFDRHQSGRAAPR